jgi:hypothetical protein
MDDIVRFGTRDFRADCVYDSLVPVVHGSHTQAAFTVAL